VYSEDSEKNYEIKYPQFTEEELINNSILLQKMPSVKTLTGNEMDSKGRKLSDAVKNFFESLGHNVYTERFGNVSLSNSSVRSELRHGFTRNKITSFAAIPDVMQKGVVISAFKKNQNLERIVVAAPIEISKQKFYMGVMLQRDNQSQRLYLHDVVIEKESTEYAAEHLNTTGPLARNDELYITNILLDALSVKNNKTIKDTGARANDGDILFSLRDSTAGLTAEEAREQSKAYTRLKAERAALQRRLDYWKGQSQRTKQASIRKADTDRYVNQLLKQWGSKADRAALQAAMQGLGNYLVRNNGENLSYEELHRQAAEIADEVLSGVETTLETGYEDVADELLSDLRDMTFHIPAQYLKDLPENFRKEYKGKLHISTDRGTGVDVAYQELQETYGYDLFPADIINPAEQMIMIAEAYERMRPELVNPFEHNMNEMILSLAHDILDTMLSGDIRQTAPTRADKAQGKLEAQKAKDRAALDRLRAEKNARIEAIKRQESLRRQEAVAKERARKWAKVASVKAHYQEMQRRSNERRRESAAASKYRAGIIQHYETLQNLLIRNTDKEHVPEALREPLINFLDTLDMRSLQQIKGKGPTQRDTRYTERLRDLKDILERQAAYMENPEKVDGLDIYLDLPDGFSEDIQHHIKSVEAILNGQTDVNFSDPVATMNAAQLEDLEHILTVLTSSIQKINSFITESHYGSVVEGAKDSMDYLRELGKDKPRTRAGNKANQFMEWSNALPYYVFKRFGPAGMERFKAIIKGWGKMAFNARESMEYAEKTYTGEEAKRWEDTTHSIKLSNGELATMTEAQMMSLWCLARRKQGLGHLLAGGMRVGDIETGGRRKKQLQQVDAYHLTQDDLAVIGGMLSPRQIEVAEKLQKFMNTVCAEWGNEISMARFGYRQFTEENYFPITTDRNNHHANDPQARETDIFRLLNMAFSKALTPNANNSVVINSIFDVFAVHTADMAKYNGLALPVLDLMKWYNYKDKSYKDVRDSSGETRTQITSNSVQASLERTFGKQAQRYFLNFVKDLNGIREGGRNEEFLKGALGRYKAAAVGANLRVAIQQPTSIARAAMMLPPELLAKGAAMKGGIQEAMQHSGLAVWKDLGYFDTNIARNMRDQIKHTESLADKITDKSMILAEYGDKATWGAIWNACKLEVSRKQGLRGEELLEATADRFDEVILATQVIDSTISRSDMMRGQNLAVSEVTSFMSEPTVTYNMLLDVMMEFNAAKRRGGLIDARKQLGAKALRAGVVFVANTALTAMAAAIVDAMRDDDDYQTYVEKWLEHFWDNLKDNANPLKLLPIVSDLWSLFMEKEDPQSMLWQPMTQIRNAGSSAMDMVKLWFNPEAEVSNPNRTTWGRLYYILQGISSVSGLPVSGGFRDMKAVWNTFGQVFTGKKLPIKFYDSGIKNNVKYALQDGHLTEEEAVSILIDSGEYDDPDDAYWKAQEWLHAEDSEWTRYEELYAAIRAGDTKAYTTAVENLGDHGISAASARTEAKNYIERRYTNADGQGQKMGKKASIAALQSFAGLTEHEAMYLVDEWTCQVVTHIAYADIGAEFVDGNIDGKRARELYITYGHMTEKEASDKLLKLSMERDTGYRLDYLDEAYIHGEVSREQAISWRMKYAGDSRTDAEGWVRQRDATIEVGVIPGSSDNGWKQQYIDGTLTADQIIAGMIAYDGQTPEDAATYAQQYDFTKETGYNWSESSGVSNGILEALRDEKITREEAVEWYRKASRYTHGSEEIAREYLEVIDWRINVPGADSINRDALEKWRDYGYHMSRAGLGKEDFADAWSLYQAAESRYDAEGNKTAERAEVFFDMLYALYTEGIYSMREIDAISRTIYSKKTIRMYRDW